MGWDMFSEGPRGGKKPARVAFRAASKNVIAEAGSVDCLLSHGALDCSACARWMETFSETKSAWADWSPEDFAAANENAQKTEPPDSEAWAYWSAREFIRVCAENGLRGWASY